MINNDNGRVTYPFIPEQGILMLDGATANTAGTGAKEWPGCAGVLWATATDFDSGSVQLQWRIVGGVFADVAGAVLGSNGQIALPYLPKGEVQLVVTGIVTAADALSAGLA